jgi:hypothetical protein
MEMWALGPARDLEPPGQNPLLCRRFSRRILAAGLSFIERPDDEAAAGNHNVFKESADQFRLSGLRNVFQMSSPKS